MSAADPNESEILAEIKIYCRHLKFVTKGRFDFTRVNLAGVRRGGRTTPNPDMKGFADIEVVWEGRVGYTEVKRRSGLPSPEQIAFFDSRRAAGAKCGLVRSLGDFQHFLAAEMGMLDLPGRLL